MILVDTPIWVDHLHLGEAHLVELLDNGEVLTHPFVIGELAGGSIRNRSTVLALLDGLESTDVATNREVRSMVERLRLWGQGLSLVDAHLLASTRNTPGATIWSRDRRLMSAADGLGVAARSPGA